jgi:hypothetical protein
MPTVTRPEDRPERLASIGDALYVIVLTGFTLGFLVWY